MTNQERADDLPASPEGISEPFRPATYYDLKLVITRVQESDQLWEAQVFQQAPEKWKSEVQRSTSCAGALSAVLLELNKAMVPLERDGRNRSVEAESQKTLITKQTRLMTTLEVAEILGVSSQSVLNWIERGALSALTLPRLPGQKRHEYRIHPQHLANALGDERVDFVLTQDRNDQGNGQ